MHWYQVKLSGKAGTNSCEAKLARPEVVSDLSKYLEQVGKNGVIARGYGNSYADQSLNNGGAVIQCDRLDRIYSFDEATGELVCEAGMTLTKITEIFLNRGFVFPFVYNSDKISLAEAISTNINLFEDGNLLPISQKLNWLEVCLSDGKIVKTSKDENVELFNAVVGGMGLLGIITKVSINLNKAAVNSVKLNYQTSAGVEDLLKKIEDGKDKAVYLSSKIDVNSDKNRIGEGVVLSVQMSDEPGLNESNKKLCMFKKFAFSHQRLLSLKSFRKLYHKTIKMFKPRVLTIENFIREINVYSISKFNRVYQISIAFSKENAVDFLTKILTDMADRQLGPNAINPCRVTLEPVCKDSNVYLSVEKDGYVLNLDFIHQKGILEYLRCLLDMSIEAKCQVLLNNDSLLDKNCVEYMYSKFDLFKNIKNKYDKLGKFKSDFSKRLFGENIDE
ncbi:MAG: FAD-binding oxidoreductase [Alphaproteobacteria bacterium]|nr:FAD-binding oxidoreductase [Alphaproteobacteria bacterium]